MKRTLLAACLLFSTLAFYACDSNKNEQASATNGSETTAVAGDTDPLNKKKKKLIPEAAQASMMQIELGKIALERSSNTDVKQYAQLMVDTYTTKTKELQEYAQSENVTLPQSLARRQQKRVQKLRDTEAQKFDMEYWNTAIRAHRDAINEFDDALKKERKMESNSFTLWAMNTMKEKRAQMSNAMRYRLALRTR